MVVPNRHLAALEALTPDEQAELMQLTRLSEMALNEAYRPQGINVGINLGKAAGAGIENHLHIHLVPRWSGDTNFMTAVGETRVLPEDLAATVARLRPIFETLRARPGALRCVWRSLAHARWLRVRPRRGALAVVVRAGRAEAPQRDHLRRRWPSPRLGQSHRHAGALQSPHRRGVLRQQPRGVSNADDAERGGDCDGTLPGRHRTVRQPALRRLSAVRDRQLRPASRHDGARRRRSVRARGHQRSVRRQLPARSVAARVRAIVRLQHGRARKDRACRGRRMCRKCCGARGAMREPVTIILDGATGTPRAVPLGAAHGRAAESGRAAAGAAAAQVSRQARTRCPARAPRTSSISNGSPTPPPRRSCRRSRRAPSRSCSCSGRAIPIYTQHAQGDSLNRLTPGINGPTSKAAIQNADRNLKQILDYLDANPDVRDNTNVFVTSDHGFSTVSRRDVDASGRATRSYSATLRYKDADGRQEVNDGFLPPDFSRSISRTSSICRSTIPSSRLLDEHGVRRYAKVDPSIAQPTRDVRQRPSGATR